LAQKYRLGWVFYEKIKNSVIYNQSSLNRERNELLANLPKRLAMHLSIIMNESLIRENKFFDHKNIKFITTVIDFLRPMKVNPKEIIYKKHEPTEDIYLIKSGEVLIFENFFDKIIEIEVIHEGDFFGEIEVFLSEVREYSAKATKSGILFTISREELLVNVLFFFQDLQLKFIEDANKRKKILDKKVEQQRKKKPSSSTEEQVKETYPQLLTPNIRILKCETENIRKTLAPTSKALLEENDEVLLEVLKDEIDRLNLRIERLESVFNTEL
jgi:CRP-like cAMP-binding protein